jgi:hypothetical protein
MDRLDDVLRRWLGGDGELALAATSYKSFQRLRRDPPNAANREASEFALTDEAVDGRFADAQNLRGLGDSEYLFHGRALSALARSSPQGWVRQGGKAEAHGSDRDHRLPTSVHPTAWDNCRHVI